MDVFISWAGTRSHAVAEALSEWLPMLVNAARPWLSSHDIDGGARWPLELASILERAEFGVICLTPKSLHSDWILYEAGALSKTLGSRVCPLLIDLKSTDVTGPLSLLQSVVLNATGVKKLAEAINAALPERRQPDAQLGKAFDALWPSLKEKLDQLPRDTDGPVRGRNVQDIAEETLNLVRSISIRRRPIQESTIRLLMEIIGAAYHSNVNESFPGFAAKGLIEGLSGKAFRLLSLNSYHSLFDNEQINYELEVEAQGNRKAINVDGGKNAAEFLSNLVTALAQSNLL